MNEIIAHISTRQTSAENMRESRIDILDDMKDHHNYVECRFRFLERSSTFSSACYPASTRGDLDSKVILNSGPSQDYCQDGLETYHYDTGGGCFKSIKTKSRILPFFYTWKTKAHLDNQKFGNLSLLCIYTI